MVQVWLVEGKKMKGEKREGILVFPLIILTSTPLHYNISRCLDEKRDTTQNQVETNNFGLVTHLHGLILLQQLLSTKESSVLLVHRV